jgi:SAM-dependent methyltransferase
VSEVTWHDVECGGYSEDLDVWETLAERHGGPVLELGPGTGRVSLHLARRGHEVAAVEVDPELVEALSRRAAAEGLPVSVREGDVRALLTSRRYPLVIGAMQLIQMLGSEAGRAAALRGIAAALAPDGVAALAIVEGSTPVGEASAATVPDVREVDGFVYSSLPLDVAAAKGHLRVRRLRQVVDPTGGLTESEHVDVLDLLDSKGLAAEAERIGLQLREVMPVAESELHVGSSVVILGRAG